MGIVSRFERRLQGAVGDAFARVFGGHVVPQEVEAALQQAAADGVRELDGGHLLAPNSYMITINEADHAQLAVDHDLTVHAFEKHLADYIRDQGWQTCGEINVHFDASATLHTGQFRTSGTVDPDIGRRPSPPSVEPYRPEPSANPEPGAGSTMTQNSGYDPSRDPADDDRGAARSEGVPRLPQRRSHEPDYRNGSYSDEPVAGSYQPNGYPPAELEHRYSSYQNGYDRGYGSANPEPAPPAYPERSYPPADSQRLESPRPDAQRPEPPRPEAQRPEPARYDAGPYGRSGGESPYDRRSNEPPAPSADYSRPGYGEPEYAAEPSCPPPGQAASYPPRYGGPGAYAPSAGRGSSYDANYGPATSGYNPPADYDPGYGGRTGYTATLQLDDGSGRTYQLREGSNIIGRGQDAHFRLPDTGVSRRHIEVRWDGRTAMLSDLGSTNGTLVNGAPVQDWQLADGDVIRAGHSEILIRIV